MGVKITVTIEPDTNYLDAKSQVPDAMAKTLSVLSSVIDVPMSKTAITIQCADKDAERIRAELHIALSGRPVGINATMKTQTEEYVAVKREPKKTPMDDVIDGGVERVEISHRGHTVTLTSETARKAAEALKNI